MLRHRTEIAVMILVMTTSLGCQGNSTVVEREAYPKVIDSLHAQFLYDDAKWRLYCYYSDDTVEGTDVNTHPITAGMLDLKYDHSVVSGDTLVIAFFFVPLDSNLKAHRNKDPEQFTRFVYNGFIYINGRMFAMNGYSFRGYHREFDTARDSKSRFITPLQPEVISYIKENRDKINPWFREEAIKRGVLQK